MISAASVASAAPVTPKPSGKMRMGSSMALNRFANRLIFIGVSGSKTPRNAEKPIKVSIDGKNAKLRMNKYGKAYSSAGAPSFNTDLRTILG
mmetsp:Transcript_19272/g.28350  ORF Transcript_19272/g.28350 Transcript_19272/m.28350 type:complete len:92 (-) Transcript_19272:725-1000(-)